MTVPTDEFEIFVEATVDRDVYEFSFKLQEDSDLVVVNLTNNVTYDIGTHYTVVLNKGGVDSDDGDTGGVMTFIGDAAGAGVAPYTKDDGDNLHIYRLEDYLQLVNLKRQGDLNLKVLGKMFDKATIQIQQVRNGFDFLNEIVIPGLRDTFENFVNGILTVLGPGGSHIAGGIPVWLDTPASTLSAGIVGDAPDQILKWNNVDQAWELATGIPVLDLGTVTVPGSTSDGGIAVWGDTTGTSLESVTAGTDLQTLMGNTGANPSFVDLLTALGRLTSTAGQTLQFNGTNNPATIVDPATGTVLSPAVLGPTSAPSGFKLWGLGKPGNYTVGNTRATTTGGSGGSANTYQSTASGSYLLLITGAVINRTGEAYTTRADVAATRSALPIWLTRILTGPVITNTRIWVGLNKDDRTALNGSATPGASTAAFRYDTSAGDTTWKCVTCTSAGVSTVVDSGVTVTVDTDWVLAIDMSESGNVKFWINGVLEATIATNLPDADDNLDWVISCRTLNAASKRIGVGPVNLTHR